jgi:integrase
MATQRRTYSPGQVVPWSGRGTLLVVPRKKTDTGLAFKATLRGKKVQAQTGKGAISATYPRLTDAKAWLTDTAARLNRGELKTGPERRTLGDLSAKMAGEVWTGSASWHGSYCRRLSQWVDRLGSATDLQDVEPGRIQTEVSRLADVGFNGRPLKPKTVREYTKILGNALRHAVRWGWIEVSPVSRVTLPAKPLPKYEPPPPLEERQRLIEACSSVDRYLGIFAQLVMECGGRRGETSALRWCDLDLDDDGRVTFRAETTKSKKTRTVPLSPAAPSFRTLRKLRDEIQPGPHDPIFPWKSPPFRKWKRARTAAGLLDVTIHTLRKWAASFYAMAGASLRDLVDFLGHADFSQVMVYAHLCENSLKGVAQRAAEKFHVVVDDVFAGARNRRSRSRGRTRSGRTRSGRPSGSRRPADHTRTPERLRHA